MAMNSSSFVRLQTPILPSTDKKLYSLLRLNVNDLEVLLISDKDSEKASAALDVNVGHLLDHPNVAGLAHFCEHLLFMGTEKYPTENDYSEFLSKHGGYSNAYTSTDHTNYYFAVDADHLSGALDRFAQFFIAPLFSEGSTDRELNAVDSEHKKNLQSDSWRLYQLDKDLSNPSHPYNKFGTGNLETLSTEPKKLGLDVRKVLLEFHDKYYSSNIMRLVVLGKEPLNVLEQWVVEKFSEVKNKNIKPPEFEGHALTNTELLKVILAKPVKDMKDLEITFPFPDTMKFKDSKPSKYLSHLLGHESEGSILSLLKRNSWATGLSAGESRPANGFGFFKVSIDLTDDGQASLEFKFKEQVAPESYTSRLSSQLHNYSGEEALAGPYLIKNFDSSAIKELLSFMRVDSFRVLLTSSHFDTTGWGKAKWYGTEFKVEKISESLIQRLNNLKKNPDLHLPPVNDFIPTRFDVRKLEAKAVKPFQPYPVADIIIDSPMIRLWYKKDDTFYTPKASVWFKLFNPLTYATPTNSVLTKLYTDLIKEDLNEFSYMAEVSGLSYDLEMDTEGLVLALGGYNDKISILLSKIIHKMKTLRVDPDRFRVIKERLQRNYRNFKTNAPNALASYYTSYLLQEKMWSNTDKNAVINDITLDDVQQFVSTLFKNYYIEGLVHGNIEEPEAKHLVSIVQDEFAGSSLPLSARGQLMRTVIIPRAKPLLVHLEVPNAQNLNSAVEYYIQIGDSLDQRLRGHSMLFQQIISEPCFDQLRTKEQLGYLVHSGLRRNTRMIGFRIIVQSEREPEYVEQRIEEFLKSTKNIVVDLTEEEFRKHISSVTLQLLEKDKNLRKESNRLWGIVNARSYDFAKHITDAEYLNNSITKESLLKWMTEFVDLVSEPARASIWLRSAKAAQWAGDAKKRRVLSSEDDIVAVKFGLSLGLGVASESKL
ncbi:Insulinase (Peptidase M16), partial [Nowakowskiella sp. JEL0078]